jgi:MoaA/NifB/PqqE/SkfB family radical SAM enzyme
LRDAGIPGEIITYASRRSGIDGVRRIMALGREVGVTSVYILLPFATGAWDGATEQLLGEDEKAALRRLHGVTYAHLELPTASTLCCALRRSVFYVSPYGDVTPCPLVPFVMGNVRQHALETLWQRYCSEPAPDLRGDCVMNDRETREAVRRNTRGVASVLAGDLPQRPATAGQAALPATTGPERSAR